MLYKLQGCIWCVGSCVSSLFHRKLWNIFELEDQLIFLKICICNLLTYSNTSTNHQYSDSTLVFIGVYIVYYNQLLLGLCAHPRSTSYQLLGPPDLVRMVILTSWKGIHKIGASLSEWSCHLCRCWYGNGHIMHPTLTRTTREWLVKFDLNKKSVTLLDKLLHHQGRWLSHCL